MRLLISHCKIESRTRNSSRSSRPQPCCPHRRSSECNGRYCSSRRLKHSRCSKRNVCSIAWDGSTGCPCSSEKSTQSRRSSSLPASCTLRGTRSDECRSSCCSSRCLTRSLHLSRSKCSQIVLELRWLRRKKGAERASQL